MKKIASKDVSHFSSYKQNVLETKLKHERLLIQQFTQNIDQFAVQHLGLHGEIEPQSKYRIKKQDSEYVHENMERVLTHGIDKLMKEMMCKNESIKAVIRSYDKEYSIFRPQLQSSKEVEQIDDRYPMITEVIWNSKQLQNPEVEQRCTAKSAERVNKSMRIRTISKNEDSTKAKNAIFSKSLNIQHNERKAKDEASLLANKKLMEEEELDPESFIYKEILSTQPNSFTSMRQQFLQMEYLNMQIRKFTGTIYKPRQRLTKMNLQENMKEKVKQKIQLMNTNNFLITVKQSHGYKPKSRCMRRVYFTDEKNSQANEF